MISYATPAVTSAFIPQKVPDMLTVTPGGISKLGFWCFLNFDFGVWILVFLLV